MKVSVAALAATLVSMAAAQSFPVSGIVVDSETGAPLNRTRMVLTGGPVPEQSLITTANGKFAFNVPQGKYTLLAAHRDWGVSYGQLAPARGPDSAIVTGPDQDTTEIVLRWYGPGAIRGKVVDETGEPVHSASLELLSENVVAGKKRLTSLGKAESDELGYYSWSSLAAGTYYLVASGEPWYYSDGFARQQLAEAGRPPVPYAPTYFPGTLDARAATPLVLRPGAELHADFILRPVAGASLRPVCSEGGSCIGSLSLFGVGLGGVETLIGTTYVPSGEVIPALLPGRYVARYTGVDGEMRKIVDITGGDATIDVAPKPAPSLAGKVVFPSAARRPRCPVYVNLLDEDTGRALSQALGPDGSFSWPALPVSRGRLLLTGDDGFYIARISVEGARVKDGVIEIVDGATIQVNLVAGGETGMLKGFVKTSDQPVPAVKVVLAPGPGSTDPNRYLEYQTDSDGSFEWPTVPAGEYVLFAVDNLELEYSNPDIVRPYLAGGKTIRVEPNGIHTETFGLTKTLH